MGDRFARLRRAVNRWADRYRTTRIVRATVTDFVKHEALQYAGSMAYFATLSLANLLVLGVVVASYVVGAGTARQFVVDRAVQALPMTASQVGDLIDRAIEARGAVSLIGLVLLLWSALGVFGALSAGITRVFDQGPRRAFWKDRLLGLGLLAATGILAAASVLLGIVTQLIQQIVSSSVSGPVVDATFGVLAVLFPMVLVFVAFLLVYRIVPTRRVDLAEALPGALVATLVWTVLRIGFTFYATRIARYDTLFGPIGAGISLLVFLYFSSVIVLLGAEVTRAGWRDDALAQARDQADRQRPAVEQAETEG